MEPIKHPVHPRPLALCSTLGANDKPPCGKNKRSTMAAERITATYRIETPLEPPRAAAVLAGEQSSGTFVNVPGETAELRARFGARVERVTELEPSREPSLPGATTPAETNPNYRRAEIVVSWPLENVGHNLPTL